MSAADPPATRPPAPFWPRRSPHFLACRLAVRTFIREAANQASPASPASPIAIGLSGGPDSLALVAAVAAEAASAETAAGANGKATFRAVVVDHGLQPGSAVVAARAAEQARGLGVEVNVVKIEIAPESIKSAGLEAAAREARYAALAGMGESVWVAHTADDQAETLLLGALRGNPAGMAATELMGANQLVRPFLTIRRADTVGACEELGLEPWHDPMNFDPAYRRVALRTQTIPALSELLGGDAVPALARTAARIAEGRQLIDLLAGTAPTGTLPTGTAPTADCRELAADHPALRRRRLAAWLIHHGVPVQSDQLNAIDALVTDWRGQGPVHVAGGTVSRKSGQLFFTPISTPTEPGR